MMGKIEGMKGGQPGPGEVSFPPLGFNLLVGRMPRVEAVQPLPRPGSGPLNSSVSLRGWSPRPDSRPRLLRLPSPTLTGPSRRGEPRSLSSIRPAEHPPHGEVHVGAPVRCVPLRRPRRRWAVWACVFACHPVDSLRGRSDEGTPSSLRRGRCAQKHTGAGTQGMCVCVCGRSTRLWVAEGGCECLAVCGFVDVAAFVCLQALLGMSACTFTRVCVCHVPPQTCSEARGCILVARGGPGEQTSCRHHHSPFLFLFFFYPFLSIDRHV